MKKFNSNLAALCGFALLGTVLTLSSCSSDAEEVLNPSAPSVPQTVRYAPVRVQVNEFSMSMEDVPEAQTRAVKSPYDYSNVGAITLAFYDSAGTLVCDSTQIKTIPTTFDTFGDFSLLVPVGDYTMVVIARDSIENDVFTLTSPTVAAFTSEKVRETFCHTQAVSITSTTALDLSVTLTRCVSQLSVTSTDPRPNGVDRIRTTFGAGGKRFNPTTGLAIDNTGFSVYTSPSKPVGNTVGYKNLAFLATDEQTMTITLEVLDEDDNVLITKEIPNVSLKRNRKTILRGPLFTPSASAASFVLETSWLSDHTINFN